MTYVFWKFHFMPLSVYGVFPLSIKSIEESCLYTGLSGVCHHFKCREKSIKIKDSRKMNGLQRQNYYLINGEAIFRNKKEFCPGLNGMPDYLFELNSISASPTLN